MHLMLQTTLLPVELCTIICGFGCNEIIREAIEKQDTGTTLDSQLVQILRHNKDILSFDLSKIVFEKNEAQALTMIFSALAPTPKTSSPLHTLILSDCTI